MSGVSTFSTFSTFCYLASVFFLNTPFQLNPFLPPSLPGARSRLPLAVVAAEPARDAGPRLPSPSLRRPTGVHDAQPLDPAPPPPRVPPSTRGGGRTPEGCVLERWGLAEGEAGERVPRARLDGLRPARLRHAERRPAAAARRAKTRRRTRTRPRRRRRRPRRAVSFCFVGHSQPRVLDVQEGKCTRAVLARAFRSCPRPRSQAQRRRSPHLPQSELRGLAQHFQGLQ